MREPSGDPSDLIVEMVAQAYEDVARGNGHSATALEFLMSDTWVAALDVSPRTVERIRGSLPAFVT